MAVLAVRESGTKQTKEMPKDSPTIEAESNPCNWSFEVLNKHLNFYFSTIHILEQFNYR